MLPKSSAEPESEAALPLMPASRMQAKSTCRPLAAWTTPEIPPAGSMTALMPLTVPLTAETGSTAVPFS